MKFKLICFLIITVGHTTSNAQDVLSVEPSSPDERQNIELFAEYWVCNNSDGDNLIQIHDNIIRVFEVQGTRCETITPVPPMSLTENYQLGQISALNAGTYTYEYYRLPYPGNLPTLPDNYSQYLVNEMQFVVRGSFAPTPVNAISNLSLLVLITLLFAVSIHFFMSKR